jgi:hypothetical protein
MKPIDLVVGQVYFQVTFSHVSMTKPIIISYEYVQHAKIEDGYFEEGFEFKYLPAFHYEFDDGEMFPTDDELTFFTTKQVESLLDLNDLIRTLERIKESAKER